MRQVPDAIVRCSGRSEGHTDQADEDLVTRSGVEPVTADRHLAPGELRKRSALDLAIAAIGIRALAGHADAQPLDRAVTHFGPGVEVAFFHVDTAADVLAFEIE